MKMLVLLAFALAALARAAPTTDHVQYAIRAGSVPVRGVNLGGWLVVENWINSKDALWDGVPSTAFSGGEMTTMRALGHDVGDARFQTHWDTFITEEDIANIASASLNTVRVPVGWWIVGYDNHDPPNRQEWKTFAPGGLQYLDRLIEDWAVAYNVAVLVDIHAAKGSQNGNDHSAPTDPGQVYWSGYQENIDNTIEVARFLADRYRNAPSFLGIELLNEPTSVDVGKLKEYYVAAYNAIRSTGNDCVIVTSPILWEQNAGTGSQWEGFMVEPAFTNVWHDWHKYLIWGYEGQTADQLLNGGLDFIGGQIAEWTGDALIMGEWCIASPDSAAFTADALKRYADKMVTIWNTMQGGWTFWTWKQEWLDSWSLRDMIQKCVINPKLWDPTYDKCP
jgi:glucan 1,3-beta-glucosidase